MKKTLIGISLLFFLSSCISLKTNSKLELPPLFSDNMVFQQKTDAPIWGTAAPGKVVEITTSWNDQTVSAKADVDGAWKTTLKTPSAGGPFKVTISDGTSITLTNVMVGEVWICSGQSNMEMPLAGWGKVMNYEQEIKNANNNQIRLFQVKKGISVHPSKEVHATSQGWDVCSEKTVSNFSALAYFYARELQKKLNVPVGVIDVTWGGTIAEAWTSASSLKQMPVFAEKLRILQKASPDSTIREKKYQDQLKMWNLQIQSKDKGYKGSEPVWAANNLDDSSWKDMSLPSHIEDVCLPEFDGVIWFRKKIELSDAFLSGDLQLSLGTIDDDDICYFNGKEIGRTYGFDVPRKYIIPENYLKKGTNILTVRVIDTGDAGGIYGEKDQLFVSNGSARIKLSGVWKYQTTVEKSQMPGAPVSLATSPNYPTLLYNAMLHPLIPFAMKGVIWYQGESNASRAYQYRTLFPLLIRDWRKHWNRSFPFYYVQLANFKKRSAEPCESDWAELREAQLQTLSLENTGMAVITDIGDANNIHPKNKQEVARRLSLIALANSYGEKLIYSGPVYHSFKVEKASIRVLFDHAEGGLIAKDGELKGFTIAGADRRFYRAKAVIQGNQVVVSSDLVKYPVAVRYAWDNNPECSLYNGGQLPASPFRSDDWPGITRNNQ